MVNHVWGLLAHPHREWRQIRGEHESVSHHYLHHVLLLAAIPVVCSIIGTTQVGWQIGGTSMRIDTGTAVVLGLVFYLLMLAAVYAMGSVIHWLARRYPDRPSHRRCVVFAGYIATPLFLSGLVALYPAPLLWAVVGLVALCYTGYLLQAGIPDFLDIDRREGMVVSGSAFAIGVLVLEALLAAGVLLWGYGIHMF
ncbi:Yip1 family protein [Halotalea alkalilenta]|uniref:Yip1 family protein n=1 Tax=Halotalea alkalilenta TaxID=376489 RepID=UPI000488F536|nr:Yip1 family protein [Halotalea alkalilenta]